MLMQHYTEGFFHWSLSKLNSNAQNTLRVKYIKVTVIKVNLVLIASQDWEFNYIESTNSDFK